MLSLPILVFLSLGQDILKLPYNHGSDSCGFPSVSMLYLKKETLNRSPDERYPYQIQYSCVPYSLLCMVSTFQNSKRCNHSFQNGGHKTKIF